MTDGEWAEFIGDHITDQDEADFLLLILLHEGGYILPE